MIKQTFVMSLLLISAQAIASTSCPTCKKGYVALSLEEVLIAQQKVKGLGLTKGSSIPHDEIKEKESAREKSPVEIIVSEGQKDNRDTQTRPARDAFRARAPKRDKVLETADTTIDKGASKSSYGNLFSENVN